MNALVPGFTKELLASVAKEKSLREPDQDKVLLSKEMATFLANQTSLVSGPAENIGHYLKEDRNWAQKRKSRPYDIKIGNTKSSPMKLPSKISKTTTMTQE